MRTFSSIGQGVDEWLPGFQASTACPPSASVRAGAIAAMSSGTGSSRHSRKTQIAYGTCSPFLSTALVEHLLADVMDDAGANQRRLADAARPVEDRQPGSTQIAGNDPLLLVPGEEESRVGFVVRDEADVGVLECPSPPSGRS